MKLEQMKIKELLDTSHTIAEKLFEGHEYPWEVLGDINGFIESLGASLPENEYKKIGKNIWIHKTAQMAPTTAMGGPMIIGPKVQIRNGAFLRGSVILGQHVVIGNSCEIKNSIIFDEAQVPHFNYVGDSILGSIVALALYQAYPQFDEGRLTRLKVSLVSGQMLSEVGQELGIDQCIIFGASETGTGARGLHSALENVYESLVGALFLDGGRAAAEDFITRTSSLISPPIVPSVRAILSPTSRNACRATIMSRLPTSSSVPVERLMSPSSPQWCSWTALARAREPVPRRRRPRQPQRSMRSSAWATPLTAVSSRRGTDRGAPCT